MTYDVIEARLDQFLGKDLLAADIHKSREELLLCWQRVDDVMKTLLPEEFNPSRKYLHSLQAASKLLNKLVEEATSLQTFVDSSREMDYDDTEEESLSPTPTPEKEKPTPDQGLVEVVISALHHCTRLQGLPRKQVKRVAEEVSKMKPEIRELAREADNIDRAERHNTEVPHFP